MRTKQKQLIILSIASLSLAFTGCTIPHYSRTVERSYDANGKLTGTVVKENVSQIDPTSKPLLNVLENQTYQK